MQFSRHMLGTSFFAFGALLVSSTALAQVIPNQARPEFIERRNRIEDVRPALGGAPLITLPEQDDKPIAGGVEFTLKGIRLQNATAFSEKDLKPLYAKKIGKPITVAGLNKIAADITAKYRNAGYILTRAVVPPQRAEAGVITIRIVEGFVNEVRFNGDAAEDSVVQGYAAKIRASKPLDAKDLERYLLLMDDLPGIEARAVLQPSETTPGASDVVVNITRKKVDFTATLDNRGSRFLGQYQAGATVALNDVFRADDQTQMRIISSAFEPDELFYAELRHEEQLGSEGLKLVFSGNHAFTKPGSSVEQLDIEGHSQAYTVGLNYPIKRSRQANWFVSGDFTARNVEVDTLGSDLYFDKTRVLGLSTAYDFIDSTAAVNRIDAGLAKGFSFGTDVDNQANSRANGETSFTKFTGRASRIQPIMGSWSAYGVAAGQYSLDPLLASEEFALGGSELGSAYDPAELTGDSGLAGRLELQYNQSPETFISQYQLYGFYDIGRVWNEDPIAGNEDSHASLSSAGLGARFNIADALSGGVEGSLPLTKDVAANGTDGAAPRIFFNLLYRY